MIGWKGGYYKEFNSLFYQKQFYKRVLFLSILERKICFMLDNHNNYYIYDELITKGSLVVKADSININNWRNHYDGILSLMKDGIEADPVKSLFVTIDFGNGEIVDLTIPDYYFNLILWYNIIALGDETIKPYHLVFLKHITSKDIKKFIDKFFILKRRTVTDNRLMNNIIADGLYNFIDVDDFSLFLANTLNLEDSIDLMDACPDYDKLIHCDLSNVPIENVKDKGMEVVHKAIDIIMNSVEIMGHEHCLRNAFAAQEGINIKQYKENSFNIGTKPDGQGSIYHDIINQSYITGGLNNLLYEYIDCGASRVAQIISKKNVGESGGFSRILGLNAMDTFLNPDMDFDCHTNNLAHIFIKNKDILNHFIDRYARLDMNAPEFLITSDRTDLIGKWIYLRTPAMCRSFAEGHGICKRCYGELSRTNIDINIGRIATEIITMQYTQMRLSAKHLLETMIIVINWVSDFYKIFDIDINSVSLNNETFDTVESLEGWNIIIKPSEVQLENDDDFFKHIFYSNDQHSMNDDKTQIYNEYVTDFQVESPDGTRMDMSSIVDEESGDNSKARLYISNSFSKIIRNFIKSIKDEDIDSEDFEIVIPLMELQDINIFFLKMQNNDLGKALDVFTDLINKKDVTKKFDISTLIMKLVDSVIKGKIHCRSIHLEVILANQIRNIYDRLKMPDWSNFNEPYEVLTLNEALTDHPSVIVSLIYQKLVKSLYDPMTFKKNKSSVYDPFFMHQPLKFMNVDHEIYDDPYAKTTDFKKNPVMFVTKGNKLPPNHQEIYEKFRPNSKKTRLLD